MKLAVPTESGIHRPVERRLETFCVSFEYMMNSMLITEPIEKNMISKLLISQMSLGHNSARDGFKTADLT